MDVADVGIVARLHRRLERLGLVLGDVAGVELTTGRRERMGGRVLVGHLDRGPGDIQVPISARRSAPGVIEKVHRDGVLPRPERAFHVERLALCGGVGGHRGLRATDRLAVESTEPDEMILITQSIKELQLLMSDYVGIVRTDVRLQRAMKRLDLLHEEIESLYESTAVSPQLGEARNLITIGYLIVKGAEFRKESRGLHFNTDYPGKSELLQNIVL